jgi:hypothetical protein
MSATATQIATVRRMVNEPTETTYSDELVAEIIEANPIRDERGVVPYYWDYSTTPPEKTVNQNWIETYDLNLTASIIWEEKAAAVANEYDVSADDTSMSKSNKHAQYLSMASRYRAKSSPRSMQLSRVERMKDADGTIREEVILFNQESDDYVVNR